jgi:hypothetical protein
MSIERIARAECYLQNSGEYLPYYGFITNKVLTWLINNELKGQ